MEILEGWGMKLADYFAAFIFQGVGAWIITEQHDLG
jgi:hypothetical protein